MKKLNKKGFTIIELVIVIAVIAILAAVMVPTFSSIVDKANASAVEQEANSCFTVIQALDWSDGLLDGKDAGKTETDKRIEKVNDVIVYSLTETTPETNKPEKYIEYSFGTDGKTFTSFTFYNTEKNLKVEYKDGSWGKATKIS